MLFVDLNDIFFCKFYILDIVVLFCLQVIGLIIHVPYFGISYMIKSPVFGFAIMHPA